MYDQMFIINIIICHKVPQKYLEKSYGLNYWVTLASNLVSDTVIEEQPVCN